ncbi:hypothetical protein E4U52_003859 [Claviceps spartinae]|nr:hypothetical protein E4U52_003859 [Claviceps spartinae]
MLIKGASINSMSAFKSEVAVAAHRQSGDTVITLRDSSSRPKPEDWVQTAFGPDATVNRRVFSVVVKGFPVRLSENQELEDIRKKLAAANGPSSVLGRDDESRNVITVSQALDDEAENPAVYCCVGSKRGLNPIFGFGAG